MAAPGRQSRHAAQDRRASEVELLADGGPVAVLEALEVHHSVDAREPRGRDAGALAALLDLAAHRDEGVGAPVEPRGDAVQPHRACVVEGTHEAGGAAAEPAEPVIVRVVDVDHVDALGPHRLSHPAEVADRVDRIAAHLEREARQGLEARLASLLLEPVARDEPQQHSVPARAEAGQQADHRLRAAGPPAVGHQVQHGQRSLRAHASSSS